MSDTLTHAVVTGLAKPVVTAFQGLQQVPDTIAGAIPSNATQGQKIFVVVLVGLAILIGFKFAGRLVD